MKYTVSKIRLLCNLVTFSLMLLIYCLIMLRCYGNISLASIEEVSTSRPFTYLVNLLLFSSLLLLLVKDFVPRDSIYSEIASILAILMASAYAFLSSLADISRLRPGSFTYIPPAFIVARCDLKYCESFATLIVSIPLGVATAVFVYDLYIIVKTFSTIRVKNISKIVNRFNV